MRSEEHVVHAHAVDRLVGILIGHELEGLLEVLRLRPERPVEPRAKALDTGRTKVVARLLQVGREEEDVRDLRAPVVLMRTRFEADDLPGLG